MLYFCNYIIERLGYGLDDHSLIPVSVYHVQYGSRAYIALCPVVQDALCLMVKQPGCEANNLPSSSASFKYLLSYFSTYPCTFMV